MSTSASIIHGMKISKSTLSYIYKKNSATVDFVRQGRQQPMRGLLSVVRVSDPVKVNKMQR
jgi:hypothetical protein